MLSSAGNGGESASGGGAKGECESALELGVVVVCFPFLGGRGASQLPGCEGGRGRVSFGVGCCCCLLSFFGGAGGRVSFRGGCCCCLLLRGMEASQLPGGRRGKGGESALELGVVVCFFLGGGGRVSFQGGEGGMM